MPVKHWSFAGLVLTYWCNARCECCYLACGPQRGTAAGEIPLEHKLDYWLTVWQGLVDASPHGCRVHLTGGEPFGNWPGLIELCRRAQRAGIGPLEKVETNGFWATDAAVARERLVALRAAGMQTLAISADPYHQQFVPLERCRLLAAVAEEVLGCQGVQVRWRDWLRDGFDTAMLDDAQRREVYRGYLVQKRERLGGRAADRLAGLTELKSPADLSDSPCRETLLRGRHVHIDANGHVMPGTCAGLLLGSLGAGQTDAAGATAVAGLWQKLNEDWGNRPILSSLANRGPLGLLDLARQHGFERPASCAGKCHLCWQIRRQLVQAGAGGDELGPAWMYADEAKP